MRHETSEQFTTGKPCFGRWLIGEAKRDDAIGGLARAAFTDTRFPRDGDLNAVWKYINAQQPGDEIILAMEDAELDWSSF